MPIPKIKIPEIPLEEQNDLVWELADVIDLQQEEKERPDPSIVIN